MQILLLEVENEKLHGLLAQCHVRMDDIEKYGRCAQDQLALAQGSLESVQSDLRIKLREIETLKARSLPEQTHRQDANSCEDGIELSA